MIIKHHIKIDSEWIPGEEDEMADYCSRIIDTDDWMLNLEIFSMLDELCGLHTVDWFSNVDSTHTDKIRGVG